MQTEFPFRKLPREQQIALDMAWRMGVQLEWKHSMMDDRWYRLRPYSAALPGMDHYKTTVFRIKPDANP